MSDVTMGLTVFAVSATVGIGGLAWCWSFFRELSR
jgi:hypothetical protein